MLKKRCHKCNKVSEYEVDTSKIATVLRQIQDTSCPNCNAEGLKESKDSKFDYTLAESSIFQGGRVWL